MYIILVHWLSTWFLFQPWLCWFSFKEYLSTSAGKSA